MDAAKEKGAEPRKEKAPSKIQRPHVTKKDTILAILRGGTSLNRFEAERHGDHCLHSTIATLRNDGIRFHDEWEDVPTRFGKTTRVKRYRYVGIGNGPSQEG